ncbi:gliding motility-associated C-terminal domain-containing protein [Flavobacterium restrictum]|uniref:Gliding motility-associated C-terminal domain-containing protein n=1 Tax=Flavobacterium restrictum TaxID=2594428 RepID=A0A553DY31_9FLAO|nr:gliding motility-associated C-terminal domain-containing protein [Flavobacterium restrictum]TRX37605.1 gliding motility-associated C-terminal domain-containing protein [Flavobacterium restrictum]
MKNTIKVVSFILFVLTSSITAQTVNTGDLYISSGTIMSTVGAMDNKSTGNLFNDGDFYVYSHYNNDGLVSFTSGSTTGITRMRGMFGYQDISGSIPMEWYNGEFYNTKIQPAFHLSNEVSISGTSNFQKGIVDDDNYGGLLVFENTANHINVDDASHVDGYVRKNGDDAFQFPIGDKEQFRYAAISAPENATDAFTSKYFLDNSNPLYPHVDKTGIIDLIDNQEYWAVDRTKGDSPILLTLSWDEDTTPATIYAAPYDEIHIVRWDANRKLWIDEGGATNPSRKEVTSVVTPSGYGVFTLARVFGDRIVLPCNTLTVYNAISPNGDGKNEYFKIDGLNECSADNTVEIYNRWGVKVYETSNYGSNGNVFKGYSDGRVTVSRNEMLPSGTYFYILNFKYSGNNSQTIKKAGYLYLDKD